MEIAEQVAHFRYAGECVPPPGEEDRAGARREGGDGGEVVLPLPTGSADLGGSAPETGVAVKVPRGIVTPLGTRREEMICAARGRQVQLTQAAVHEMFRGNRAALLEVFCGGMELTLGARAHGLCAPDGVDKLFWRQALGSAQRGGPDQAQGVGG